MTTRSVTALIFMTAAAAIVVVAAFAQEPAKAAFLLPPPAVAKLCGNFTVTAERKTAAFHRIQAEGCEDVHFVHIGSGHWIAYGTRVLIGETND